MSDEYTAQNQHQKDGALYHFHCLLTINYEL